MPSSRDAFSKQKVEEFRRRAENARERAEEMAEPDARRMMLEAADTWERMAQWEEEHPTS